MDVALLNGSCVKVDPACGLRAAKQKIAEELGVLADAVVITCEGQLLKELKECQCQGPLFALVDQGRLEFARQWALVEQELVVLREQHAAVTRLGNKLAEESKKLGLPCRWVFVRDEVRKVKSRLHMGTGSLSEEKALVLRLFNLENLVAATDQFDREKSRVDTLHRAVKRLADTGAEALLVKSPERGSDSARALMQEFQEKASARLEALAYEAPTPLSWYFHHRYEDQSTNTLDLADDLDSICPRLLLRQKLGIVPLL